MDKKFNFTQARVRDLPAPQKGRFDYYDIHVNKLVCRVSHTGNKSFLVTKRVDGKLKNVTIGKFPNVSVMEARKKAHIVLTELSSGIDPTAAKRQHKAVRLTLNQVFELYISERKLKPLTTKGYRYNLQHH